MMLFISLLVMGLIWYWPIKLMISDAASNIPRGGPGNQSKQLLLVLVQMFLVRSQYVYWCASCAIWKENGYCFDAQRCFFVQF